MTTGHAVRSGSVVHTDQDALNVALDIHLSRSTPWPPVILDCTYNVGKMWRGMDVQPTFVSDILPRFPHVILCDYRRIHERFFGMDVVVFDPPHTMDAGRGDVGEGSWAAMYGTREEVTQGRLSIAHTFPAFLDSARRVLVQNGLVLAKIGDQTHGQVMQWEHCMLWLMAKQVGMTPCDLIIKHRTEPKKVDPKWANQYHVDKVHSFWMVIRNGLRCQR